MNSRLKANLRTAFGWLVIAAIVLRGLVPAGYMPDFSKPTGAFPALRICGGHMPAPANDPKAKTEISCPFSINAAFSFAGTGGGEIPFALIAFIMLTFIPAALLFAPRRIYGNASSRAPPRFF